MILSRPIENRILRHLVVCGFAALLPLSGSMPSHAGQTLAGPYTATVERVIDGDTLAVRVSMWIGQELRVLVRIRGVDAPAFIAAQFIGAALATVVAVFLLRFKKEKAT